MELCGELLKSVGGFGRWGLGSVYVCKKIKKLNINVYDKNYPIHPKLPTDSNLEKIEELELTSRLEKIIEECKFGRTCFRPNCWNSHKNGNFASTMEIQMKEMKETKEK